MKAVLTIAGSDASAGAGLQADLKTFAALGVYGQSAVTAVTSQGPSGVSDVFTLPASVVRSQIEALAGDTPLAAVKTGMLATADIVSTVADILTRSRLDNVVVDPVIRATAGTRRTLLEPDAVSILVARLIPRATVVTPNIAEAAELAGVPVNSLDSAREAARRIVDLGAKAVVVKGGHLEGDAAIDLLFDGRDFTEFSAPRIEGGSLHGTGCTFASAVAAGLALGDDTATAVDRAKRYVSGAIAAAVTLTGGERVLNHFWLY
jgi:hydroxymethylpyrimidine/phosphomethylpyrimidine kinase